MKLRNILIVAICSMFFIACTKDDEPIQEQETIIVDNGQKRKESSMLKFESQREFEAYVKEKNASGIDLLEEARMVFEEEGRLSLLLIYQGLEKHEAERLELRKEEIPVVESPDSMLLYLLNEDGEIGIEDKIFRIDGDFVYTYTGGNGKAIDEFLEAYAAGDIRIKDGETISFSKDLTVFKHTNKSSEEEVKSSFPVEEIHHFNGNNARMIARQWNGHYAFYSSIGSVTKTQEWSKFLWWGHWKDVKTDNRLEWSASYYAQDLVFETSPRIKFTEGKEYCNCYEAKKIYEWSAGLIAQEFNPRSGVTKHWSHWYQANPNTVGTWIYY